MTIPLDLVEELRLCRRMLAALAVANGGQLTVSDAMFIETTDDTEILYRRADDGSGYVLTPIEPRGDRPGRVR